MSNPLEMHDPNDAAEYLEIFSASMRKKGESYFRQGRVSQLTCLEPGTSFSSKVLGSEAYDVQLTYDEDEGWGGTCTCPMEFDCKHVYAGFKALLARQSVQPARLFAVEGPGWKVTNVPLTPSPPPRPPVPKIPLSPVAMRLQESVGRQLRPEELTFLRKLALVYQRCCQTHSMNGWDLEELGFRLGGYSWDRLNIWPSFPKDEHEFWLYVACALQDRGNAVPDFMQPITHLEEVRGRLQSWKRNQEIERWQNVLQNARASAPGQPSAAAPIIDLQVRVKAKESVLEWKRPGRDAFEPLKQSQVRQLTQDCDYGHVRLTEEGEMIWQVFHRQVYYGNPATLVHHDPDSRKLLARLFRLRWLTDRIVTDQGQPFTRVAEPLRWSVTPPDQEQGDYHVRLVQSDGSVTPPILVMLPGNPPLYLTATALFPGPPVDGSVLNPALDNLIPAPALEHRAGIEFLHALRMELPPRLRERVRHVPMHAKFLCSLKPSYPGNATELFTLKVIVHSEDGCQVEQWNGHQWTKTRSEAPPRTAAVDDRTVALYDRSNLAEVPGLVESLGAKWDGYHAAFTLRLTKKFPELFVPWLKSLPPHIEVSLGGDLASLARDPVAGEVKLEAAEVAVDWFDLNVVLDVTDTELTQEELKLLLNAKGRYVRLDKKGWRRLEFNLSDAEDEQLARLGLNPHELSAEPQRLHALQLADDAAKRFLPEEQVTQITRRAGEILARVTPDIPDAIHAELRPYQRDGFHFLAYLSANHFGGILADDMGLGKTLQALAWLMWLRAQPENAGKATLVVCPKSVMDNWRAEAERFTRGLRVKIWPPSELDSLLDRLGEADLHVLNYSQLRIIGESLAPISWLAVVLDEGQYIKNPNSQTAQVARSLRADHRLVLSGTPIENRLLDLWSLMTFAMPGALSSRAHFAKMFDAKDDPFARRRLAARVRPFLLRRTKTQVAKDLPDKIEEDLYCEIEGEQKTLYRAEFKRAQQMLLRIKTQKELSKERFHFLTSLLRLRQICCHPALVNPDSAAPSAKVEALLEQLEPLMEEGNKVLVFSQFVGMLDLLKPVVAEKGWPQFYLAGETENRGELVQEFQSAKGAAVFLISLKAGGFGLNLTAASYVVLFDPWWNPAVETQAIDRTHRIGQTRKVIAYRLLIKDSIEEKIRQLQKQKSALVEDVLGEEKFSQSLTLEDLQFLFAD